MLSTDNCIRSQNPPIPNCQIQLTVLNCLKCRNGYFNTNLNLSYCQENSLVDKCFFYDTKSDNCQECESNYTVFNGKCMPRQHPSIQGCGAYKKKGEGCETCLAGFYLASDGLGCYQAIPNCNVHKPGTLGIKGRKTLTCIECASNYFMDWAVGHTGTNPEVLEGVVILVVDNTQVSRNSCVELPSTVDKNCEIFSKESLVNGNSSSTVSAAPICQKCKNGYYLNVAGEVNTCKKYPQSAFERCALFSGFSNKQCLQCDYQNIILKTKDLCLPPSKPMSCIHYKSQNKCKWCNTGYFGEDCLPIPESLNCIRIQDEGVGLNTSKLFEFSNI